MTDEHGRMGSDMQMTEQQWRRIREQADRELEAARREDERTARQPIDNVPDDA